MKSFGELLNSAINVGSNVNALAGYCGVTPRTIYRYINNERTPDEESFAKIIRFLALNPKEKKELTDSYNASVIGIEKYQRLLAVEHFLRKVISMKYEEDLPPLMTYSTQSSFASEVRPIENSFQIQITIQSLMSQEILKGEDGHIFIVSSHYNLEIFDALAEVVQYPVKIDHIFSLGTHTGNAVTKGIQHLSSLAPIAMTAKNYATYSYYTKSQGESALPYFSYPEIIITSNAALMYNCSSRSGILFSSPLMVNHFQSCFTQLKQETSEFTKVLSPSNIFGDFLALSSAVCHDDGFCCTIRTPISITCNVTEDIIHRNARNDPDTLEQAAHYIDYVRTENERMNDPTAPKGLEISSIRGLHILLDTGEIQEIPESLYNRLSSEDRIKIVESASNAPQSPCWSEFHLLKDDWTIGDYGITVYFSSTLIICYFKKKDGQVGYFTINDPGIATAFCEYITSQKESLCYSEKDSFKIIKDILDQYKSSLK